LRPPAGPVDPPERPKTCYGEPMTDKDPTAEPAVSSTVTSARQALEQKRAAAAGAAPTFNRGKVGDERAAAARSASRSKPALRK
jgi:hypothetical protein